ncbi:MAG: serpin family protein [Petrimonas sp.]|uniref:serpin family protein n=1 Tax=Petrimonas sp. TaxID=2023866 RepID=UPI002B3C182E|nr:serpin family protein [Petrimonas sp.]MEA4978895.1 serpin family protein [Petrimonas sp.]MEA5046280.1 serpin family protein [Petrimonas sp.]
MSSKIKLTSSLLLVAVVLAGCEKSDNETVPKNLPAPLEITLRAEEAGIVKNDQQFAFELFSNVFSEEAKGEDKSFMVSPFSLSMALAMTWNGAAGETKTAMQETLKMGNYSDDDFNGYYKKLKEALLKTDPSTQLSIANAIFTNKFVTIKPNFIKTNTDYYHATVQPVDFSLPTTKDIINRWASDNTNNLIKEVIDKTNADDLMYLLNAIYFKGIWTTKFDAKNTSKKAFLTENGTKRTVDMMSQTAKFNYTEDEIMQVVQLPYGNQAFSMLVLLPQSGKKQTDVVSALQNKEYWGKTRTALRQAEVVLSLPKFKTEYSIKLNEVLGKMGMGVAFDPYKADFSRMSEISAFISFVKQDTYISTDESGTEAAAVTVIGMEMTSAAPGPQKVIFNADRPFIYVIQENSTGAILFMGAVKDIQ